MSKRKKPRQVQCWLVADEVYVAAESQMDAVAHVQNMWGTSDPLEAEPIDDWRQIKTAADDDEGHHENPPTLGQICEEEVYFGGEPPIVLGFKEP